MLRPVLPAFLPGEVSSYQRFQGNAVDEMIQSPFRSHVPDNQHPLCLPPRREVGKEAPDPLNRLLPTLAARIGLIEVTPATGMKFGRECAVEEAVVAFAKPPVMKYGEVRPREGEFGCLDCASQVGREDRRDTIFASAVAKLGCEFTATLGQAPRQPAARNALFVVLAPGVGFEDDLCRHQARLIHWAGVDHLGSEFATGEVMLGNRTLSVSPTSADLPVADERMVDRPDLGVGVWVFRPALQRARALPTHGDLGGEPGAGDGAVIVVEPGPDPGPCIIGR